MPTTRGEQVTSEEMVKEQNEEQSLQEGFKKAGTVILGRKKNHSPEVVIEKQQLY